MKISELFYSIQGEGKLAGVPSVFVRASGCNLRCTWCDTPYASWNPEGKEMPVAEIAREVARLSGDKTRYVVITGGEPMMFKETADLIFAMKEAKRHVTVETAGTLWLEGAGINGIDLASISPKLSNSTPRDRDGGRFRLAHDTQRINMDVLKKFATKGGGVVKECQWKFVISRKEDVAEMENLLTRLNTQLSEKSRIEAKDVLLMPEGIDPAALADRSRWLADLCKEKGYRYCPRLHIQLYGNKRGT